MASISRVAGGLGNLLLSLLMLCFSAPGVAGNGPSSSATSPEPSPESAKTVHVGHLGDVLQATASVERVSDGRVWTLRLELWDPERRRAHESE
jgi:hypothetical protein